MREANEKGNGGDRIDQNDQPHAPGCVSVPLPFDKCGVNADINFFTDAYFFSARGGWHGSSLQLQNERPLYLSIASLTTWTPGMRSGGPGRIEAARHSEVTRTTIWRDQPIVTASLRP